MITPELAAKVYEAVTQALMTSLQQSNEAGLVADARKQFIGDGVIVQLAVGLDVTVVLHPIEEVEGADKPVGEADWILKMGIKLDGELN